MAQIVILSVCVLWLGGLAFEIAEGVAACGLPGLVLGILSWLAWTVAGILIAVLIAFIAAFVDALAKAIAAKWRGNGKG